MHSCNDVIVINLRTEKSYTTVSRDRNTVEDMRSLYADTRPGDVVRIEQGERIRFCVKNERHSGSEVWHELNDNIEVCEAIAQMKEANND
jgi:hypothetical protein